MHVVTLGGGHGQAAVLQALTRLQCEISAVVSVADDGGCSGQLRTELGMPPPGDLRRCLTALARDRELADSFEVRFEDGASSGRSAGNLALAEAYEELGSLQSAVDWAAEILCCRGRVVPAAETQGILTVYDMKAGAIEGETEVEARTTSPVVAAVHGPTRANPVAIEVLSRADLILMGPGSFITSTLATLTTAGVADAVLASPAHRVLVLNLGPEGEQTRGFCDQDYVRLLRDHLEISTAASANERDLFSVLGDGPRHLSKQMSDGTAHRSSPLSTPDGTRHDPLLMAQALQYWFDLDPRPIPSIVVPAPTDSQAHFDARVDRARRKISSAMD